jgi:hypothetical protein
VPGRGKRRGGTGRGAAAQAMKSGAIPLPRAAGDAVILAATTETPRRKVAPRPVAGRLCDPDRTTGGTMRSSILLGLALILLPTAAPRLTRTRCSSRRRRRLPCRPRRCPRHAGPCARGGAAAWAASLPLHVPTEALVALGEDAIAYMTTCRERERKAARIHGLGHGRRARRSCVACTSCPRCPWPPGRHPAERRGAARAARARRAGTVSCWRARATRRGRPSSRATAPSWTGCAPRAQGALSTVTVAER